MATVTVKYRNQNFDVDLDRYRVKLWWIQGNRWGQNDYRFRDITEDDRRFAPVIALAIITASKEI